jgi:excisionase family DNA binding protein
MRYQSHTGPKPPPIEPRTARQTLFGGWKGDLSATWRAFFANVDIAPSLRLLKVREVAELFGVSTATVYALCKHGALRHVRVANAIRVPEAALGAFGEPRRGAVLASRRHVI